MSEKGPNGGREDNIIPFRRGGEVVDASDRDMISILSFKIKHDPPPDGWEKWGDGRDYQAAVGGVESMSLQDLLDFLNRDQANWNPPAVARAVIERVLRVTDGMKELRQSLEDLDYPFGHERMISENPPDQETIDELASWTIKEVTDGLNNDDLWNDPSRAKLIIGRARLLLNGPNLNSSRS